MTVSHRSAVAAINAKTTTFKRSACFAMLEITLESLFTAQIMTGTTTPPSGMM
jgi:hypothetical protein